jgi:hypothetical protein
MEKLQQQEDSTLHTHCLRYIRHYLDPKRTLKYAYDRFCPPDPEPCELFVKNGSRKEVITAAGKEIFYPLAHGSKYKLVLKNGYAVKCDVTLYIDGHSLGTWRMNPHATIKLARPAKMAKCFTFYRVKHAVEAAKGIGSLAPSDTGIQSNCEENGLIRAVFVPHDLQDGLSDYHSMLQTSKQHGYRFPIRSVSYPIPNESTLHIEPLPVTTTTKVEGKEGKEGNEKEDEPVGPEQSTLHATRKEKDEQVGTGKSALPGPTRGPRGGRRCGGMGNFYRKKMQAKSEAQEKWVAGGTTLQGECTQTFGVAEKIPLSLFSKTVIYIRLVAEEEETMDGSKMDLSTPCTSLTQESSSSSVQPHAVKE